MAPDLKGCPEHLTTAPRDIRGCAVANLAAGPLAKVLDPAAITQTQQGLVNEFAKASGMPAPHSGSDMLAALSGKVTDPEGVGALTSALSSAADQLHIGATEKTALLALLAPITSRLLGK